jgi:peptidoglycan/LPS O-acetylase OafA/YrhL
MAVSPAKSFSLNNFDLIRIATAFLVLVNHSIKHLNLSAPAWYDVIHQFQPVPMFFVLSGFLLSGSFERNGNLTKYARNRISRIYPALWLCILLSVIIFSVWGGINFYRRETIPWFFTQLVGIIYTPEFMQNFGYGSYNGSLWTIVIELQFYLILPLIYYVYKSLFKKTHNAVLFVVFGLAIIMAFLAKTYPPAGALGKVLRYTFIPYVYIFIAGILIQQFKLWKSPFLQGKGLYWIGVYLAWCYLMPTSVMSGIGAMVILACCTISLGYTSPGIANKYLKNMDMSYGVYLFHGMVLSVLVERQWTGSYIYLAIVAVTSLGLAFLSYKFVEHPAMNWAKNAKQAPAQRAVVTANT